METIGFKITVEFYCPDMISEKEFMEVYGGNPEMAYKAISDNFQDSPINFAVSDDIVKIEVI